MRGYDTEFIQSRAITPSAATRVDFLRSQEVAERVASEVRSLLAVHYKNTDRRVVVKPSTYRGTWAVEARIPGILRRYPGGEAADERDIARVVAALKAAVKSGDLVSSWKF